MAIAENITLGIDPGTNFLGYCVLETGKSGIVIRESGVLTLTHIEDPQEKLRRIFEKVTFLIRTHQPTIMAVEAPFFGKNVQSMLKLGRAQGVAIAASLAAGIPFEEYAPRTVKQAITGKGNATKEQVAAMLDHILKTPIRNILSLDASDALAVAVCHHFHQQRIGSGKKKNDWSGFIKNNPDRVA